LANGAKATILLRGTPDCSAIGTLSNTAKVALSPIEDTDLTNNTSLIVSTTVTDTIVPTFTLGSTEVSYCVNNIISAVYNPNPNLSISPEYDDLTTPRPEYYQFTAGSTIFDLDQNINKYDDNCCAANLLTLHWRIDFTPTPNPATVAHELITKPAIPDQTGQPSAYGDIQFPGDGVTFKDVDHYITYWLIDCHGNKSVEKVVKVTVKPRPNLIKVTH
jgi:hypothetical protein